MLATVLVILVVFPIITILFTRKLVHNLVAGVLTTALVLSLSIFLYATFYHAYMPIEVA